jgi:hypothetical protein
MEAIAKQGIEFVQREGRRVQNLLQGKVKQNFHANSMMITAMLMLREYS